MTGIIERLMEEIIADAFNEGRITEFALAERLLRERLDAADEIRRLTSERDTARNAALEEAANLADKKADGYDAEPQEDQDFCRPIAIRLRGLATAIRSMMHHGGVASSCGNNVDKAP